jgi:hypothetical protein
MENVAFIDIIQTIGICANAGALIYVVVRLERVFNVGSDKIQSALAHQKETLDSLNTIWRRINTIEARIDRLEAD